VPDPGEQVTVALALRNTGGATTGNVTAALLPLFFLTPILYQLDDLPGAASRPWLVDLLHWGNPLTPAVESYRTPLYEGELPPTGDLVYLVIAAFVALALGALVFRSVDDRIASEA